MPRSPYANDGLTGKAAMSADSAMKVAEKQFKYREQVMRTENAAYLVKNAKNKDVKVTASGLQYKVLNSVGFFLLDFFIAQRAGFHHGFGSKCDVGTVNAFALKEERLERFALSDAHGIAVFTLTVVSIENTPQQ